MNRVLVSWLVGGGLLMAAADAPAQTFSRDIAPILNANCVTCHHPGANAAFSLVTYEDVRPRAKAIAAATKSRYMPPWKPEFGFADDMQGKRGLTGDQIDVIQRWVAADATEGDRSALPRPPGWGDGWRLGTPDLVIRMTEAYEVPASGPDVFRLFVLPIPTGAVQYIKAIEFMPGTRAVHHANMRLDETRTSRQLDEKDPAPGYDGLLARTARFPEGYFFGWTPGQLPPASEDLAWRLNPGTDMVLQVHLRPLGKPERLQAAIGLYFAPGPPASSPVMIRLGKQSIDIAPGQREYETTDSFVLPVDVDVRGVQPHAHYRARDVKGFATLPDGTTKGLIHIADWDFDWQDTYQYVKPFLLPKGTTVTMRYTYDNSAANRRNPQLPPQRVHWGQNSSDEMGDLWIQVVPRSPADTDRLTREIRQKVFQEDIVGYETVLERSPGDVSLHDDVAMLNMAIGRRDAAIAHFSESARLAPTLPVTHFNLGTALAAAGRTDTAIDEFRNALRLDEGYSFAHNNLGALLMSKGVFDEATTHFRRAVEIDPRYAEAHNNLGKLLAYQGRTQEALEHLTSAVSIKGGYAEAHYNLGQVLAAMGRAPEALEHYRTALGLAPEWLPVVETMAWMLATHPDERLRDSKRAVVLAERAVALTARRDATGLDVLAAAYAADGRFDAALVTVQSAAALITAPAASGASAEIAARAALYRQQKPYIDTRGVGPFHP